MFTLFINRRNAHTYKRYRLVCAGIKWHVMNGLNIVVALIPTKCMAVWSNCYNTLAFSDEALTFHKYSLRPSERN